MELLCGDSVETFNNYIHSGFDGRNGVHMIPFLPRVTAMKHIAAFIAAHSGVVAMAVHTNDLWSRSSSLIKVTHREALSSVVSSAQCGQLTVQRCIIQFC